MNFDKIKNLSTEQKQQLALVVMVAGGLLYAAYEFGLKPIRQEKQDIMAEIQTLKDRFQSEKRLLNTKEATAKEYRATRDEISDVMSEQLPPYENMLSWATRVINEAAANVGIKETNLAISEQGRRGAPLILTKGRDTPPRMLNVFRVGVDFSADYHTLGRFIAAIERNNPHAHLGLLTMSPQTRGDTPTLEVRLECVFPQYSREAFPASAHPEEPLPVPPGPETK